MWFAREVSANKKGAMDDGSNTCCMVIFLQTPMNTLPLRLVYPGPLPMITTRKTWERQSISSYKSL